MIGKYFLAAAIGAQFIGYHNGGRDALEAQADVQVKGIDFDAAMESRIAAASIFERNINRAGFIGYSLGAEAGRLLPPPGKPFSLKERAYDFLFNRPPSAGL